MKFDILNIHQRATELKMEASAIASVKNSEIQRFGVRRFENGRLFQTSRLGGSDQARLISDTKEWGGPGVPHEFGFAPSHQESRAGFAVGQEAISEFEANALELASRFPEFVFSGKCSVANTSTSLASNYGLDLAASGGVCEWYLVYQRKGSGNMIDGFLGETSARPGIREEMHEHQVYLQAQKREAKLSAGRIPVLFVEALTPLQKLIESLAVHRYHEGSCLYAGRLGDSLFSPQVTLVDRAYVPEAGLTRFFDGEGVVRSEDDYLVIDKGRFSGLISDLRFGKKWGVASTGNGIRTYNSGVTLAPRTLGFAKGTRPWRDIVRNLDRCLVAVIAAGGDSNDLGEFSTPVQIGYVFEKGELVGRAPQVTVKAPLSDYLGKDLIAVASDSFTPNATSASVISEMELLLN